jgi:hypothetical protein
MPTPMPTPIVCDDLEKLGELTIVSGQRFDCTISQEQLTEQINQQPGIPCADVRITLQDGEITVVCWVGLKLSATGVAVVEDCRMRIQVTRGTVGFKQKVQELLDANAESVPYDAICIDEVEIADGEIRIGGYGR